MKCQDVMLTVVHRCRADETVQECAKLMREENIGFVPIVDGADKVIGVVTDRDLAIEVVANARPPESTLIRDVLRQEQLVTCAPTDDLHVAEGRMAKAHKARVLVVEPGGKCVGVITLSDIAQVEDAKRTGILVRVVNGPHAHHEPH